MGVSTNTYVVAGVRVSDVLSVQKRKKQEPRFDPKTGERYVLESEEYVPVLFGRDRPGLEPNPGDWPKDLLGTLAAFSTGIDSKPEYLHTRRTGLSNPYSGYDYGKFFLGVQLNKHPTKPYDTPQVFELRPTSPEVTAALKTAHEELRKLGFTSEPKLYVIKYLSC